MTISTLRERLSVAWTRETSATPDKWSPEHPSVGQCAVTALIVQDLFGGRLMRTVVDGHSHYYNFLDPHTVTDLTNDQFTVGIRYDQSVERTRDYVLGFPATRRRYDLLKEQLDAVRYSYSHDGESYTSADFKTRDEALSAAEDELRENIAPYHHVIGEVWNADERESHTCEVFTGIASYLDPVENLIAVFDVGSLIERAEERITEEHPWLDDFYLVAGDAIRKLEIEMTATLRQWASETPRLARRTFEATHVRTDKVVL